MKIERVICQVLRHELTHEKIQAEDGWLHIPDRPSLSVTLNEDFIKEYLVAKSGA